jgi:hypothetical protein
VSGVRQVEDQIVDRPTQTPKDFGFEGSIAEFMGLIRKAQWYIISARRAESLLREKLSVVHTHSAFAALLGTIQAQNSTCTSLFRRTSVDWSSFFKFSATGDAVSRHPA